MKKKKLIIILYYLLAQFHSFGNIPANIEAALDKSIQCIKKKKGNFILRKGQISSNLFVIEKGAARVFYIKDGKEVNTWFGLENELIGSILPLYSSQPSFEYIQFLEDSIIYSISQEALNEIYVTYPAFNFIGRKSVCS